MSDLIKLILDGKVYVRVQTLNTPLRNSRKGTALGKLKSSILYLHELNSAEQDK